MAIFALFLSVSALFSLFGAGVAGILHAVMQTAEPPTSKVVKSVLYACGVFWKLMGGCMGIGVVGVAVAALSRAS